MANSGSRVGARWRALPESARFGTQALLLTAWVVAIQIPMFDRSVVPMDEGHFVAAARWMLQGDLLYRDIHTGIFPGIYYLTALLFAVFGEDLLVTRSAQVVVNASMALILWRLAARATRPHWAWLPPLLYSALIATAFPVLTMLNYSNVSACFGLAGLLFLLRYLERGRAADGLAVGLLVSACGLTKQNFGALVLLALAIGLVWCRSRSALSERSWPRLLAPIVAAGIFPPAVALAHFAWIGTLGDFLAATFLGLVGSQVVDFNNALPPIVGSHPAEDTRFIFLYSPPILFNYLVRGKAILGHELSPLSMSFAIRASYGLAFAALAAAPALLWLVRGSSLERERRAHAIAAFGVIFFLGIFPSAIWSHLAFVIGPNLLLIALAADRAETWLAPRSLAATRVLQVSLALVVAAGAWVAVAAPGGLREWYPLESGVPRATLRLSPNQAALLRGSIQFIEACAEPGEPIFVAPDMPLVYFVTGRDNPTPYDLTIPGRVDGDLIVEILERTQTRCVVFNPVMYLEFPPFQTLFPELARYLRSHFRTDVAIQAGSTVWLGLVRN